MELFCRELGVGFPIVILHGLYGSSDNWMSIGRGLASSYRVVMVDQRNHGQSPHSPNHSYDDLASDLAKLFEQKKLHKAIVVGHSMGGKVAMQFASLHQQKVEALVVADILPWSYSNLVNTNLGQEHQHAKILSALMMLNPEKASTRDELDSALSTSIPSRAVRQFLLKSIKRDKDGKFRWQLNVEALSYNLHFIMGAVLPAESNIIIEIPTLFLKGQMSNYVYPEGEQMLADHFNNYSVASIPNAGHWLHAENPKAFMAELNRFLERIVIGN